MYTVREKLDAVASNQLKMNLLSREYPSLYVFILESLNMFDKIEEYIAMCKTYEDDPEYYSLYIHGYLLIWHDQQRQSGTLT